MHPEFYDAIIVGAGFSGLSCLHDLRKHGFSVKVFESGAKLGGVWHWNCYPGARTDSSYILYQFHQDDLQLDFPWTERFAGWAELQAYFAYADQRHNFSRDVQFNTCVTGASFDLSTNQWRVTTSDGLITQCRHFILCTGIAAKIYRPKFPGIEKFRGECFHTGHWTADQKVDFKNKRVAVIGTGPSGVQVIQELGPIVDHLTVFQRTPNLAVPMRQKKRGGTWQFAGLADYPKIRSEFAGSAQYTALCSNANGLNCADAPEEERNALFEKLYDHGGFAFWRMNYHDLLYSPEANKLVYDFWRKKTAARIHDPVKRDILAPAVPPHPFGAKRPSLEQAYFEVYNQKNVDLIDLRKNPISEITANGLRLENGDEVEVDTIIMATGFDAVTGSIFDMDIENGFGEKLKEQWKDGIETLLGMVTPRFPNMFFVNGPQGTAALSIVALAAKDQSEWLTRLLDFMRVCGKLRVEVKKEESDNWTAHVHKVWFSSLFPLANSWYQGANVPGKKREPLSYVGGNPNYVRALEKASANEYCAFNFQ